MKIVEDKLKFEIEHCDPLYNNCRGTYEITGIQRSNPKRYPRCL